MYTAVPFLRPVVSLFFSASRSGIKLVPVWL
jgi:hypothetical protein